MGANVNHAGRASRAYWETSGRQVRHKRKLMRAERPERTGRQVEVKPGQVRDLCKIMRAEHPKHNVKPCGQSSQSVPGDKWETNINYAGRASRAYFMQENKPGDKRKVMRPEDAPLSKERTPHR